MHIAVMHPGEMGVSIAAALRTAGHHVAWTADGRGPTTWARARAAGLPPPVAFAELARTSAAVIAVCPPHAATTLAAQVFSAGFRGIYVDANAIAPATASAIGTLARNAGARFVDGGIIGPPAERAGTTRLYLAGADASVVAAWFAGTTVDARVVDGGDAAASALKMAYAAWSKGTSALLIAIRALARAEGVDAALLDEWALSQPGLATRSEAAATGTARKAWRFAGEMQEIAQTFAAAGLPAGFHEAAADVYARMEPFKDAEAVALADVVDAVAARRG